MPDSLASPLSTVFAKTPQGQQEMQTRSLGLSPLARRVLVLVDGRRSGSDLAAFVPAGGIEAPLDELLARSCIEAVAQLASPPPATRPKPQPPSAVRPPADGEGLSQLPAAETRTAQDLEKARNFMTNTVNNIFGHHNRISLIESIFTCQSSSQLRQVYPAWAQALSGNSIGKKRLPELREKLFTVL